MTEGERFEGGDVHYARCCGTGCPCYREGLDGSHRSASEPPTCLGFAWIGQTLVSCDNCGKPAWDHDYEQRLGDGGPFGDPDWVYEPWGADLIDQWRRLGYVTPERAARMLTVGLSASGRPSTATGGGSALAERGRCE